LVLKVYNGQLEEHNYNDGNDGRIGWMETEDVSRISFSIDGEETTGSQESPEIKVINGGMLSPNSCMNNLWYHLDIYSYKEPVFK